MRKMGYAGVKAIAAMFAMLLPYALVRPAHAQERLSDKDLEQRIKNVNSDIKTFHSTFNSAVGKTSIRKTTQEKDAKALVQNLLDSSNQIDKLLQSTQFDSATVGQWQKIKPQLKDIAVAFHVPGY